MKAKVEERKLKAIDQMFDIFDHFSKEATTLVKQQVQIPTLQLTIDSLQVLINSIYDIVKSFKIKTYSGQKAFLHYIRMDLSRFCNILEKMESKDEVIEEFRSPIIEEFDKARLTVKKTLYKHSSAPRFTRKRLTPEQVEESITKELEEVLPQVQMDILTFCTSTQSSLEVFQRMKRISEEKKDGT